MVDENVELRMAFLDENIETGVSINIKLQELGGDEYNVLYNSIDTVNPGNVGEYK